MAAVNLKTVIIRTHDPKNNSGVVIRNRQLDFNKPIQANAFELRKLVVNHKVAVFELLNGEEIKLNLQNYNQDNSKK